MLRLLPFQRPASPELKLSPSATIAVVDDVGPALAAGASADSTAMTANAKTATLVGLIRPPSPLLPAAPPGTAAKGRTYLTWRFLTGSRFRAGRPPARFPRTRRRPGR